MGGGANGGWLFLAAAFVFGALAIWGIIVFGFVGILLWGWMIGLMGAMIEAFLKNQPTVVR